MIIKEKYDVTQRHYAPRLDKLKGAFAALATAQKLLASALIRHIQRFVEEAVEVVERFVVEDARHDDVMWSYDQAGYIYIYILLWFQRSGKSNTNVRCSTEDVGAVREWF